MRSLALLLVPLLAAGCERKAQPDRPYERDGLGFLCPGDWKVTEDSVSEGVRSVLVEAPGEAVVILQLTPAGLVFPLEEYAVVFSTAAGNVPVGEVTPPSFTKPAHADGYDVLTERFSISLLGQSVPHTRVYRRRDFGPTACMVITQVADEDRDDVEKGFASIVGSVRYAPR